MIGQSRGDECLSTHRGQAAMLKNACATGESTARAGGTAATERRQQMSRSPHRAGCAALSHHAAGACRDCAALPSQDRGLLYTRWGIMISTHAAGEGKDQGSGAGLSRESAIHSAGAWCWLAAAARLPGTEAFCVAHTGAEQRQCEAQWRAIVRYARRQGNHL